MRVGPQSRPFLRCWRPRRRRVGRFSQDVVLHASRWRHPRLLIGPEPFCLAVESIFLRFKWPHALVSESVSARAWLIALTFALFFRARVERRKIRDWTRPGLQRSRNVHTACDDAAWTLFALQAGFTTTAQLRLRYPQCVPLWNLFMGLDFIGRY